MFTSFAHADGVYLGLLGEGENIGKYIVNTIMGGLDTNSRDGFGDIFGTMSQYLNMLLIFALLAVTLKHAGEFVTIKVTNPTAEGLPATTIIIRALIALVLLLPAIGTGYSGSQLFIKKGADLSVYMADKAVTATAQHYSGEKGESTVFPTILENVSDVVWSIYMSQVCQELVYNYYLTDTGRGVINNPNEAINFTLTKDSNDSVIKYQWGWASPYPTDVMSDLFGNATGLGLAAQKDNNTSLCGSINLNLPSAVSELIDPSSASGSTLTIDRTRFDEDEEYSEFYTEQVLIHHNAILQAAASSLDSVETLFRDKGQANLLTGMRLASSTASIPTEVEQIKEETRRILSKIPQYGQDILDIDRAYHRAILSQGEAIARQVADDQLRGGNNWLAKVESQGFAALGAYYWVNLNSMILIDSFQKHIATMGTAPLLFTPEGLVNLPDELKPIIEQETFNDAQSRLQDIHLYYSKNRTVGKLALDFANLTKVQAIGGERAAIMDVVNWFGRFITDALEKYLINDTRNNLLINLVDLGVHLTALMEAVILFTMVAAIGGSIASIFSPAFSVIGKGAVGFIFGDIFGKILGFLVPIILILSFAGLMLKFVLPFMPLFKWLFALQSWSIMLFVAMIYAPIAMLSFGISSSQRWIDEGAKDGFLIMVEIILYPILMCLGFFGASMIMFVSDIAARIILPYLIGLADGGLFGILSITAVFLISIYAVYILILRTFDLIYELPNTVLSRFGAKPLGDIDRGTESSIFVGLVRNFATPPGVGKGKG